LRCPYCAFDDAPRRALHAHVVDTHGSQVKTTVDEGAGRLFYDLACPFCSQSLRKEINPRGRDPAFLEEFAREIRLVAFDLLLHHIEADHAVSVAGQGRS